MFRLARDLKKTVGELLTGQPGPLAGDEYTGWVAFYKMEQADERRRSKGRGG